MGGSALQFVQSVYKIENLGKDKSAIGKMSEYERITTSFTRDQSNATSENRENKRIALGRRVLERTGMLWTGGRKLMV